MRSVEADNV